MSFTQASLFCPPIKFSLRKCPKSTSLSLFPNNHRHEKTNPFKTGVLYNGYSYFTSPCHPLQVDLPNHLQADDHNEGLGIIGFYEGKNIFITGATGLLGKVLLEKILRSTPVGKVYLLIKAKDKEDACERLTKEIINSDLFECLRKKHGVSYEAFLREKLIPIVGNMCEPNLGMDSDSADAVRKDVDIIIQSAASTTLNERYDVLMDANVNAPQRLMRFAKTCKNLKLFAHISTAYVNGRREGMMFEEPLAMGDNKRKQEKDLPRLDLADEINMALKSCTAASTDYDVTKNLKKLGQERATYFGWYNTYHLTKAMGEMVLDEIRGDVPVVIIRPTVIESSFKEPFPGWIQGNRMFDPVIISYGKGQLPAFFGNPEVTMDIIPVDMVANTTIAAMAKDGSVHKPHLNVYHVASSAVNPLRYSDFFEYLYEYFNATPLIESESIARIKYFDNFDDFSQYTREEISRRAGMSTITDDEATIRKIQNRCKAKVAYAEQLCKMYEFIGFFNARFHTGNTEKLMKEMSKQELIEFEINAMSIDWRQYVQDAHIPGLKKHILNGTRTSI
ncbi:fatty acyl-coa reductase 2 [Phtheirospermum japonicum]|uniref:Fatty acyl-CoA reductase n=1 Tax=Phtheirospermum japonicum TaxID=374723 RepID=A0A830BRS7_9LAMI|nr:fatty acyl-coa reductase 2 [Phtheirospermum japonicum]